MQENDAPNASAQEDASLRDKTTNDKFFADFVANKSNAQTWFQTFLPENVLEQIDLSTLRTIHTQDVDANGVKKVGDMYFVVDMKDRLGKARRRTLENATDDASAFQRRVFDFVLSWNDWNSPDLFETALRRETLLTRGSLFSPDLQEYEVKFSRHNNLVVAALTDLTIAANLLRVSTRATDVDWSTLQPVQQQQVDRNGVAHIADL